MSAMLGGFCQYYRKADGRTTFSLLFLLQLFLKNLKHFAKKSIEAKKMLQKAGHCGVVVIVTKCGLESHGFRPHPRHRTFQTWSVPIHNWECYSLKWEGKDQIVEFFPLNRDVFQSWFPPPPPRGWGGGGGYLLYHQYLFDVRDSLTVLWLTRSGWSEAAALILCTIKVATCWSLSCVSRLLCWRARPTLSLRFRWVIFRVMHNRCWASICAYASLFKHASAPNAT